MEKQDLKETVLVNLKSVTQSCKGGVPLTRLNKDYRDLLGSPIPFKEFGYTSLESFIRSVPYAISLKEINGQLYAEGVADDSTAHIVSLVSRQKQTKPTKPGRKPFRRGGFSSRPRGGKSYNTSPKISFQPSGYVRSTTVNHSKPSKPSYTASNFTPKPSYTASNFTSKPSYNASNSTSASFSKKYDVPPRFQKLQQKNREVENQCSSSVGNNLPNKSPSPEFFHSSRASPVPLNPKRNSPLLASPAKGASSSQGFDNDHFYPQRNPRPLRPKNDDRAEKLRCLENIENARDYINMYAEINNLTVEYSNLYMGQRKKTKGYTSVLKLGGKSYQSYPELARTQEEAQDIAAGKAVESIRESKALLTAFPETPIKTEEDIQALIKNIEEIISEKPTGMFSHGLSSEYESKFQESLPKGWIEKVKESPNFNVDQVAVPYGRVPDGVSWIIRPTRNYSSGSTTPSEVSYSQGINGDALDINKLDLHPSLPKVPELLVPDGNEWGVYITYASSYIAARFIDYDEDFINFSKSMYDFYNSHSLPVSEVDEQHLYAFLKDPSDGNVLRALVTSIINEDMVECYLVDEGYYDEVQKSSLNDMHNDFFMFPYQAIHLALDGLESYEPFMKPADLEIIQEKILVAVCKKYRYTEEDMFPNVQGIQKRVYSVELYDTNDTDDLFLNNYFKETVLKSWKANPPKEGTLNKGYLTSIDETGEIYIRFLHPTKSLLEIELDKLSVEFEEILPQSSPFSSDEIFVAKFVDGKWRRAVMPEQPSSLSDPDKVTVFFLDYGRLIAVNKSSIRPLFQYTEFLASVPMQAVKCELHISLPPNHHWTEAAKMMLLQLAPMDQELIVRVVVEGSDTSLPKVNLHRRIGSDQDSSIISINDKLSTQLHLFQYLSNTSPVSSATNIPTNLKLLHNNTELLSNNSSNNFSEPSDELDFNKIPEGIEWLTTPDVIKSPDAFDVLSPAPLKPPEVPLEGEMFDVFVTIAASPHNFIVQPLNCAGAMNELRIEMQKFYSTEENLLEMDLSMLRANCFYAALHPDGEWYRVRVMTIESCDPIMAAVYYVDFGDYGRIGIQNLQLLSQRFRNLPCQAIKASLAGIKPILGSDWNPVHCVKFKEMVTERNFVSIVKSKCLKDEHDFLCQELEVVLIDTSDNEKDLYINDLLVELAMARPV